MPALTPLIKKIVIVCAVVWLAQIALLKAGFDLAQVLGVVPANVVRGWLWQPLTYMFLHNPGSIFHILFNMLMLWMFGGELERHWGSRAFLRFYLVAGAGGGISAALLGVASGPIAAATPTIGASGALFGLFAAYGMIFARRTILFMLIFPMQARHMAWILIGINFFYLLSQPGSGVSHIVIPVRPRSRIRGSSATAASTSQNGTTACGNNRFSPASCNSAAASL